ncbi:Sulfurtransferase TusE [Thiorhodovibrio winogradskyi]|uniref:Sulfurtransferase TusE n=2 Tax=Thiorhodovibrio winogradskyi TaxID=77007 RepID=A0ABZ0S8Y2_9GAMM
MPEHASSVPRRSMDRAMAFPEQFATEILIDHSNHEDQAETDAQGYLRDPADWSETFARIQAAREGLRLTPRHWAVIRHLRGCYARHGLPMSCLDLDTILHFRARWPRAAGQPRWFPDLFPAGGLSEQGHRLAGLPRGKSLIGLRLNQSTFPT